MKSIPLDNPLFLELCHIIYERNTICRKRTSIRNKLNTYRKVATNMATNGRRAAVEKETRAENGRKHKAYIQALTTAQELAPGFSDHRAVGELIGQQKARVANRAAQAKEMLQHLPNEKPIPRTFRDKKPSQVRLELMYLERDMASITIRQYEFTQRTHKRLLDILKQTGIKLNRARYYNRIDGVIMPNGDRLDAKIIEDLAVTDICEQTLLVGE